MGADSAVTSEVDRPVLDRAAFSERRMASTFQKSSCPLPRVISKAKPVLIHASMCAPRMHRSRLIENFKFVWLEIVLGIAVKYSLRAYFFADSLRTGKGWNSPPPSGIDYHHSPGCPSAPRYHKPLP